MNEPFIKDFRDGALAEGLIRKLGEVANEVGDASLMEVCGTHTVSIFRSGIRDVIEPSIKLLSGPGCPVCVTPAEVIDAAVMYARRQDTIVATFGDMVRVPGSTGTLESARAEGADVRIVYSPMDAMNAARDNPERNVVFIGVGFETTAPLVAATIDSAKKNNLDNFAVICAHKLIPPALDALCDMEGLNVNGLICPGHVSSIIGSVAYRPVVEKYGIPCVITGFEPLDILQGILMLMEQIRDGRSEVEVQYSRAVRKEGNEKAFEKMKEVFEAKDSTWRGLGVIPGSGLAIREKFSEYDAMLKWPVKTVPAKEPGGCRCGDVLAGKINPQECGLFGKTCFPEEPVGPCMVSSEGACAAYYKYGDRN